MQRHPNHELSAMRCPHALGEVDLFGPGAAEHWYEAYAILHEEAPVLRLPGQGLTVLIIHRDGWRTVYGHLGSATVDDGADVRAGQQIGTVGLTAGDGRPSIHFETRRMQQDEPVAIDPLTVLPR